MANSVEFINAVKRFGDVTAVDGVSFSIAGGETVALLGPSGCGKTTILRIIAGFERPDAGAVRIAGEDVTRLRPYQRNVGLLFQHYALFPHMTIAENVAYGLRYRGCPRNEIDDRVTQMLELVRLPDFGHRKPHQLSGGQQQRVALARALATRPGLVLLDEPLSALDAKLRQELRAELKQVLAAVDATTIVVTHDQEEAMSLGERVFVMKSGTIVQEGPPNEVYGQPRSRFVAEFMGRANWFRGRLEAHGNGLAAFVGANGMKLVVSTPHDTAGRSEVDLCVRPESIDLMPLQAAATSGERNRIPGQVLEVTPLGAMRQILVELQGGGQVLAVQPNRGGDLHGLGQPVIVGLPAEGCVVVPVAA